VIPIRVSNIQHSFAAEAEMSALVEGLPGAEASERLWFRFPLEFRDQLQDGGEPFLAALLPIAMALGQPLTVEAPVSEQLLSNCEQIKSLYNAWDPRLQKVETRAPIASVSHAGYATGCFFTGGVDSFYSLLKNLKQESGENRVTHLIFIRGYANCPLGNDRLYEGLRKNLETVAGALGQRFVSVSTNLMSFMLAPASGWDWYAGSLLAAPALCLAPMFRRFIIPSGDTYSTLSPWGSHPLVDPLWSTATSQFLHDGCEAKRSQKLERYVVGSKLALENLRVCDYEDSGVQNCGTCEKCLRTLIGLRALGIELRPGLFAQPVDLARIRRLDGGNRVIGYYLRDNLELARRCGDLELELSLLRALRPDPRRWVSRRVRVALQEIDRRWLDGRIRSWALARAEGRREESELRLAPIRWALSQCLWSSKRTLASEVQNSKKKDSCL
jgi:hypothetical protein